MSGGVYRQVYSIMTGHPDFLCLSSRARHVILTMRVSDYCGISCLFELDRAKLAEQTGYTPAEVDAALDELAAKPNSRRPWIVVVHRWVWIRNGVRFDPGRPLSDSKRLHSVRKGVATCPHGVLRMRFLKHYGLQPLKQGASPGAKQAPPLLRDRDRDRESETETVGGPPAVDKLSGSNSTKPEAERRLAAVKAASSPATFKEYAAGVLERVTGQRPGDV